MANGRRSATIGRRLRPNPAELRSRLIERRLVPVLVGPTAVGKTALSLELAEVLEAEIVSADSRQVYRYMDIGTAKPTPEERQRAPHHFIDIRDPDEYYRDRKSVV